MNRAGGIIAIMDELAKGGLVDTGVLRVDGMTLAEAMGRYSITSPNVCEEAIEKFSSAAGKFNLVLGSQAVFYKELNKTALPVYPLGWSMPTTRMAAWLF